MAARPSLDESPLSAARWRRMRLTLETLDGMYVTVGVHGDDQDNARSEDGGQTESRATNTEVATIHEFGDPSRNIPERSFIRSTIDGERPAILDDMNDAMDRSIEFGNVLRKMKRVGVYTEKRIRETIRRGIAPILSSQTLEKRRSKLKNGKPSNGKFGNTETPLIDTGQLIQSIASKVEGV